MTTPEFNKKYSKYLSPRHYGLAISDEKVIDYLDKTFETIIKEYPDFIYYQIKTKFGSSRFYADNIPSELCNAIENNINKILNEERN